MKYTISNNDQYGSKELTFESKPCQAVIDAIKGLKFRWNRAKGLWYGFAEDYTIAAAINDATPEEEKPGTYTTGDGYLGGGSFYGSKSTKHLYGAELSKAIREELKRAGIKGVTASCKTYTGGQQLTIKIKTSESDYIPFEQFDKVPDFKIFNYGSYWIGDKKYTEKDYYCNMTGEEQQLFVDAVTADKYLRETSSRDLNQYHLDSEKVFTPATMDKIKRIHSIILSYNYDESNSQVDYFDTNFYYTMKIERN